MIEPPPTHTHTRARALAHTHTHTHTRARAQRSVAKSPIMYSAVLPATADELAILTNTMALRVHADGTHPRPFNTTILCDGGAFVAWVSTVGRQRAVVVVNTGGGGGSTAGGGGGGDGGSDGGHDDSFHGAQPAQDGEFVACNQTRIRFDSINLPVSSGAPPPPVTDVFTGIAVSASSEWFDVEVTQYDQHAGAAQATGARLFLVGVE
jgi:hypothetical protein